MSSETTTSEQTQTLTVGTEHDGKRLDRYLVEAVEGLSRARVKTLIEQGEVRLNGRRARKGDAVTQGSTVELLVVPPPRDFDPLADPEVPYRALFGDEHVTVLDKPAGVPTHPLRPDEKGTLANAIAAHLPSTRGVGFSRKEPGLLHRLDTDTSGVVLVALDNAAFEALRLASKQGKLLKRYIALVEGRVASEGRVDYPLVPHRKDPKRVEAVTPHVRLRAGTRTFESHTSYKPVRVLETPSGEYTLVDVELHTAFRHQVRVHLASAGHPLVGDALYRGPKPSAELGLSRHFLHASGLRFPHPVSGELVEVSSPLPPELGAFLELLQATARLSP